MALVLPPIEKRKTASINMLNKHPDRVPVVICKSSDQNTIDLTKHKYLVPRIACFGLFTLQVRKNMKIDGTETIFFFVSNRLMSPDMTLGDIYDKFKDTDNILYIVYSKENTFG